MHPFKNYRSVVTLTGFVLVAIALLLFLPSVSSVHCSGDNPQCEFLKEKITKPQNNRERNNRNYYCSEMKKLNCSEYKNLCEDSDDETASEKTCWNWSWEMKNGRQDSAVLTMFSDNRVSLSKYGLSGKWRSKGSTYWVDWGRGEGKEDKMTLSGETLNGSNFETNWIKGEKTSCK